jgi:hypothetical protein
MHAGFGLKAPWLGSKMGLRHTGCTHPAAVCMLVTCWLLAEAPLSFLILLFCFCAPLWSSRDSPGHRDCPLGGESRASCLFTWHGWLLGRGAPGSGDWSWGRAQGYVRGPVPSSLPGALSQGPAHPYLLLRTSSELHIPYLFLKGQATDKREMYFLLSKHKILTFN